jgi:hypothetical protein
MSGISAVMTDPRVLLGKVVRAWKAKSCLLIRRSGAPQFAWQSHYHERVIRDEAELDRVRRYIAENPARLLLRLGESGLGAGS